MTTILFQQESYKRGMVLGLTMAEILLLVLFTLLLVLSTVLVEKEGEATRLSLVEKELSKLSSDQIKDPKKFFEELIIARDKAIQRADQLESKLQEANKQIAELKAANGVDPAHKWPPIINLSEAGGYYFEVGSAELSEDFKAALIDRVAPKILQIAAEYPDVDVIEVIGHTDEQIIRRRYSNLDTGLIDVLKTGEVASLVPADNAGLGISRAVAVVTRLQQDNRLRERFPRIIPMSGAQVIQVDETVSQGSGGDVRERRRIEIRLRKYAGPDTVVEGASPR
jgi:outer membrane protein OmpA-like peptidoglycan-associated protein